MSNPFLDEPQTNPFLDQPKIKQTSQTNPFAPSDDNSNPFVSNEKPSTSQNTAVSSNPFVDNNPFATNDVPSVSKSPKPAVLSTNPFGPTETPSNNSKNVVSSPNPFVEPNVVDNNPFVTNDIPVTSKSPKKTVISANPFGDEPPQVQVSKSPKPVSSNPFGEDPSKVDYQPSQSTNNPFGDEQPKIQSSKSPKTISNNPFGDTAPADTSNPFAPTQDTSVSKNVKPPVPSSNPFGDEPPKLRSTVSQPSTNPFGDEPPKLKSPISKDFGTNPFGNGNSNDSTNPFAPSAAPPPLKGSRIQTSKPSFPKPKLNSSQAQTVDLDDIEDSWLDKSTHDISNRGITVKSIYSANGRVLMLGKEKHFFFNNFVFNLIKNISDNNITKGAIDPTGTHLLLSTFNGELYYINKDLISAVRITIPNPTDGTSNYVITAMKFNSNNTSNNPEELKVLLSTSNRMIIKLSIDLKTSPIKTTFEILYSNKKKTTAEMSPFNALDWIETSINTIILASSPTCLQKIVINKNKEIAKDESILEMPLKTEPETGYFSLIRDTEVNNRFNVLWVSGKMKGIDPINPAQSSNIVSRSVFELKGNELIQINKNDTIKDVVTACHTQNHIFYLYNDRLECHSLINERKCEEPLEGGAISMCSDVSVEEESIYVSTGFCMYRFSVPLNYGKEDETFSKRLMKDIGDENKLYRTLIKRLNEESQIEGNKISCSVLYCWCVSLLLEKLNNSEKVNNVFSQMKILFNKEFEGVDKINTQIVRYMVRSCGSEEAYSIYCDCTRDHEGKVGWLMERSLYEEAYKFLKTLCLNKRDKEIGEELIKKYFGILFIKLPKEFIEFLEDRDTNDFPIFYSALLMFKDQSFSLSFAHELLQKKENTKKHGSDKALVEFIFWKYVEPHSEISDDNIKAFLDEKEHWKLIDYDSAIRALKIKGMTRSSMFMNLQKQRIESAIDDGIKLIKTYNYQNKTNIYEEDVSLLLTLPSKIKNEDEKKYYYLKAMNGYLSVMKSSAEQEMIKRKKIFETITKNKIPVEDILQLLPTDWELGEFKNIVKNAVDIQDKKQKKLNNEIETSCGSSTLFENSTARHKKFFKTDLTSLKCNFCGDPIFSQSKNTGVDQSRGAMFPCSHCFHILCIKKEFAQHPTAFARSVTQSIMFAKDEEEQYNCFAAECPICGEHSVNLIEYPYTSARDDQYWNL